MRYINSNPKQKDFTARPELFPQKRFNDKPCRKCSTVFSPMAPSHLYCSQECADWAYDDRLLKRSYKTLTRNDVLKMEADQNHLCAICHQEGFKMHEHHKLKLVVDHCHTTGKIRGMLCHNCNRALGLLFDKTDNLRRAIKYLEGATTIP